MKSKRDLQPGTSSSPLPGQDSKYKAKKTRKEDFYLDFWGDEQEDYEQGKVLFYSRLKIVCEKCIFAVKATILNLLCMVIPPGNPLMHFVSWELANNSGKARG